MKILYHFVIPSGGMETLNRHRFWALLDGGSDSAFHYCFPGAGLGNAAGIPVFVGHGPDELRRALFSDQYDALVVTTVFEHLGLVRELGYRNPVVFEIQGFGSVERAREQMALARPHVEQFADAVMVPPAPHLIGLAKEMWPRKPLYTMPVPFDLKRFRYRPKGASFPPIVAWIGRIEANKNWREFLLAGREILSRTGNVRLMMFADLSLAPEAERAEFGRALHGLGLAPHTELYSNVRNRMMPDFLSAVSDSEGALLATSRVESVHYGILEAMACRCPVVTSDSDGVRQSVIDGRTGLYYQLGSPAEAARAVLRLLEDPALRRKVTEEALRHLERHFSPERFRTSFLGMLKDLGVRGP